MFLSFQIFKFSLVLPQIFFVKSDYGVERKDIYSILYLNRRAKVVMKNSCFTGCQRGNDSVMVNFVKMLVETKNFAIYL